MARWPNALRRGMGGRMACLLFGALLLAGCSPQHAASGSPPGGMGWTSRETIYDQEIVVEQVTYDSGGLSISGLVCRPSGTGPFRVMVLAHGGWVGGQRFPRDDPQRPDVDCAREARAGWAVVESSYRGEDTSQGRVELCLGEVDDVLAMAEVAAAQPWADSQRMAMVGISHGGCIALRAAQRGAAVQAIVDLWGVTDWADFVLNSRAETLAHPTNPDNDYYSSVPTLIGGEPEDVPANYADRSPQHFAADWASFATPLLVIHGTDDVVVPIGQSCALADQAPMRTAIHLDQARNPLADPLPNCGGPGVTWSAGPAGPAWSQDRYLVVVEGCGHGDCWQGDWDLANSFLDAKVPAP